jgi:hypothetical protein
MADLWDGLKKLILSTLEETYFQSFLVFSLINLVWDTFRLFTKSGFCIESTLFILHFV